MTAAKRAHSPHQPTGTWITPAKRLAIYLRDGLRCVYCCRDLHDADPRDVTLDHLVCRADGGGNDASNLVTACRSCNSSRADKSLAAYAGPEARADIRRLTRRSLRRYLKLAKALIAGKTGDAAVQGRV
jgi:5-methylcytosine-specific restriction endonuclease McrA